MTEAMQQLDQQHDFSSALLVDHAWNATATSSCPKALHLELSSCSATNSFCGWLGEHGTALQSLAVRSQLPVNEVSNSCRWQIYNTSSSISSLRELDLSNLQLWETDADADSSWASEPAGPSEPYPRSQPSDEQTADRLAALTSLTSLRLHACFEASALTTIASLRQLRSLDISGSPGKLNLQALTGSLQQLTFLDISGNCSCALQLPELQKLPCLQEVKIAGMALPSSSLSKLGSLPVTAVEVSVQGAEGIEQLARWLQVSAHRLEALQITYTDPPEQALQQAQHHSQASTCSIGSGSADTAEDAVPVFEALCQAKQLKELGVIGCDMKSCVGMLTGLQTLTALSLNSCELEDEAVCSLFALQNLRSLSLAHNPGVTGDLGSMETLARSLQHLTRLVLICTGASEAAEQAWEARVVSSCGGMFSLKPADNDQELSSAGL